MRASKPSATSPQLRRVGVAALIAMSLGLVVIVVGQGFSSIGAVKAVEDVALGIFVIAALMGVVAFIAVRMADWREPESEAEFEALVNRSETLAREGLAVDPDENEFLELDLSTTMTSRSSCATRWTTCLTSCATPWSTSPS